MHADGPITLPIPQFLTLAGIGRQKLYDLLNAGELDSVMVGARRLIIVESWRACVRRLQKEQAGSGLQASPNPKTRRLRLSPPDAKPAETAPRKRGRPPGRKPRAAAAAGLGADD